MRMFLILLYWSKKCLCTRWYDQIYICNIFHISASGEISWKHVSNWNGIIAETRNNTINYLSKWKENKYNLILSAVIEVYWSIDPNERIISSKKKNATKYLLHSIFNLKNNGLPRSYSILFTLQRRHPSNHQWFLCIESYPYRGEIIVRIIS